MDKTIEMNTALAHSEFKPTIYEKMDFFKIPFDTNDLTPMDMSRLWLPGEQEKEYMPKEDFDKQVANYHKAKSELLFTNVHVNYDSCDCGGGYPCSHGDWAFEIEVHDKVKNKTHIIDIDGDNTLIFKHEKGYTLVVDGMKNFTYADFIEICKHCGINLESKYIL